MRVDPGGGLLDEQSTSKSWEWERSFSVGGFFSQLVALLPLLPPPPLSSSTLSPLLSSLQTLGSGERSKPASAVSSRTVLSPGERVVTQVAERARSGLATGDKNRHSSPVYKHCPRSSGPAPVTLPSEAKAALSSSQDPGIRPSGRRGRPGRRNWPGILNLPEQRLVQECPKCLVKIHIPRPGKGTVGKPEAGSRGMHLAISM